MKDYEVVELELQIVSSYLAREVKFQRGQGKIGTKEECSRESSSTKYSSNFASSSKTSPDQINLCFAGHTPIFHQSLDTRHRIAWFCLSINDLSLIVFTVIGILI